MGRLLGKLHLVERNALLHRVFGDPFDFGARGGDGDVPRPAEGEHQSRAARARLQRLFPGLDGGGDELQDILTDPVTDGLVGDQFGRYVGGKEAFAGIERPADFRFPLMKVGAFLEDLLKLVHRFVVR